MTSNNSTPSRLACSLALGFAACLLAALPVSGQSVTYTTDADFDQGDLFNLNHDAPNTNQLQISTEIQGFNNMWIANAGEDTVSKIDTDVNREVGRYRTWFDIGIHGAWSGPAPSRSAVDANGNVYVANRGFGGYPASVVKILSTGGIDRNGNSQIDTSADSNNNGVIDPSEILAVVDLNSNGQVESNEFLDERIEWIAYLPSPNGVARSLSIGTDGHLWVGMYSDQTYYKMSSANGGILAGPIPVGHTPYGSLVDGNGILWGASLASSLLRLNTAPPYTSSLHYHSGGNYGIAIGNNHVYLASAGSPYLDYDPGANSFTDVAAGFSALGISVAGNGDIFVSGGDTVPGWWGGTREQTGAARFKPNGAIVWRGDAPAGADGGSQRGAIPDANGDVWTVNLNNNNVTKYDGASGAVEAVVPVGVSPYTYSDASGSSVLQQNPTGTWTVEYDTGAEGTSGCAISWNATVPDGTILTVEARAADTIAALQTQTYVTVSNGSSPGLTGRYIQVKVTMRDNSGELLTPVLYDLSINCNTAPVAVCRNITLVADASCQANATAADFDGGSYDPDQGDSITVTVSPAGPYPLGVTGVTVTVTDSHGASDSCTATVTVVDQTPPVISCPPDVTLECPGDTSVAANGSATATDNCSVASITYADEIEPGCGNTFTVRRTWTATDGSGNSASCVQTISIVDTTAPVITSDTHDIYPKDAPITFTITASDTCGSAQIVLSSACHKVSPNGKTVDKAESCVVTISGNQVTIVDGGGVGTIITISATATDECGNKSTREFPINVLRPANEGVGNGVDGNTPGHPKNGGNDDPGQTPGNPGARNK